MLVNDHQSAGQLAAAERRVTWELGFTAGATRSDLTAEGNRRASVAPTIGWPLGRTLSPYGLVFSGALGDGVATVLGDGELISGNAPAMIRRILAIEAAF